MSLRNFWKKLWTTRREPRRFYEAAQTTRVNSKHWKNALPTDADSALLPALDTLRQRCKYELRNSGYAEGMARTYSDDLVGSGGPRLQIESDSQQFNEQIEDAWQEWCKNCDLSGKQSFADLLWMLVRQLWSSGEFFVQKVTDDQADGPIKLRLLAIAPERIETPLDKLTDDSVRGGIKFDPDGKPVEYYVLKRHPGDRLGLSGLRTSLDYDVVPAENVLHVYRLNEPGQTRGQPWLAPVLEIFAHLRQYIGDTLLAARVATMMAAFMQTSHPDAKFDDLDEELSLFDIEPGSLSVLPQGWSLNQLKPEHPATTFKEFKREMLCEIGRPVGMPYLRIAADASGHNYSSARLDLQTYWMGVATVQGWIARSFLEPVLQEVVQELRLSTGLSILPLQWKAAWVWPAVPHVDPAKEADAQTTRLSNMTTTLAAECKAVGLDWEEVLNQRAREKAKAAELGLELTTGNKATENDKTESDNENTNKQSIAA